MAADNLQFLRNVGCSKPRQLSAVFCQKMAELTIKRQHKPFETATESSGNRFIAGIRYFQKLQGYTQKNSKVI